MKRPDGGHYARSACRYSQPIEGMMGRTSGFTVEWPVRIPLEDGRTLIVEIDAEKNLRVRVDGTDEWQDMGSKLLAPSIGAVVGGTLRWWRETTGEVVILAPTRR